MNIKQAEVHGMSQRGGEVMSHLRISDSPIFSDIIPKGQADMILSLEPLEALRYQTPILRCPALFWTPQNRGLSQSP